MEANLADNLSNGSSVAGENNKNLSDEDESSKVDLHGFLKVFSSTLDSDSEAAFSNADKINNDISANPDNFDNNDEHNNYTELHQAISDAYKPEFNKRMSTNPFLDELSLMTDNMIASSSKLKYSILSRHSSMQDGDSLITYLDTGFELLSR